MKLFVKEYEKSWNVIFEPVYGLEYDAVPELYKIKNELLDSGYSIEDEISDKHRIIVRFVDNKKYEDLKFIYRDMESQYIKGVEDYTDFSFSDAEYPVSFRRVEGTDESFIKKSNNIRSRRKLSEAPDSNARYEIAKNIAGWTFGSRNSNDIDDNIDLLITRWLPYAGEDYKQRLYMCDDYMELADVLSECSLKLLMMIERGLCIDEDSVAAETDYITKMYGESTKPHKKIHIKNNSVIKDSLYKVVINNYQKGAKLRTTPTHKIVSQKTIANNKHEIIYDLDNDREKEFIQKVLGKRLIPVEESYIKLHEQDATIEVENPGILEVPKGKNVDDLPIYHFVDIAKKRGLSTVTRALNNLQVWNKNKNPKLSKWAGNMIDKVTKRFENQKNESIHNTMHEIFDPSVIKKLDRAMRELGYFYTDMDNRGNLIFKGRNDTLRFRDWEDVSNFVKDPDISYFDWNEEI